MEALRNLLTAYAYNICGSYEEAKDIVQDVFLQFMQMDTEFITREEAYLKRMVINRAINRKKEMQKVLISYPGEWLPEPVATQDAEEVLNRRDILSYSLMVLLENLNPVQRAVFILKEAFDYEHSEIALVLGIKTEYSRQLLSRAKKQLHQTNPVGYKVRDMAFLKKYMEVIRQGDTSRLELLLTDEIIVTSDGGGKVRAGIKPLSGKKPAAAFIMGIYKKFYRNRHIEEGLVNHQPALFYFEDDVLATCQIFSFHGETIHKIFFVRNPDKLQLLQKASA